MPIFDKDWRAGVSGMLRGLAPSIWQTTMRLRARSESHTDVGGQRHQPRWFRRDLAAKGSGFGGLVQFRSAMIGMSQDRQRSWRSSGTGNTAGRHGERDGGITGRASVIDGNTIEIHDRRIRLAGKIIRLHGHRRRP